MVYVDKEGRDTCGQQDQVLQSEQMHAITNTGYVLVFYQNFCLGVGLYFSPTEHEPTHRLRSLVDLKLAN